MTVVGEGALDVVLAGDLFGLLGFGLCGGLDSRPAVGDLAIGSNSEGDASWRTALMRALPEARLRVVAGPE